MLDMLEVIEPNSMDAIITDPPYELNFMNKGWDNSGIAFQKETWEKCYGVLKPGAYLLAFGGTRTFHRIACAIEDAGFEIRDTIMWLYGCYSEDTQVLTDKGWKFFYNLDKSEHILQWNKDTNKLSWIKPLNYFEYDIDEEMYLFENRHISQLVTKNHKVACQVKKRRKPFSEYQLVEAQNIMPSWILNFPLAGELDGGITEDDAYIIGWWLTDAWKHKDGKACMFSQSKPDTLKKLKGWFDSHGVQYSEYVKHSKNPKHKDEHIFYVTGELANKLLTNYSDREIPWSVLMWDTASRKNLLEGLMDGDGSHHNGEYSSVFWSKKQERLDVVQALCVSLNYRAFVADKGGVVFNTAHNSTQTQTRHHKDKVAYKGKVYCLETETGAFVVRRNGKAFISGNSGFPKSMNIGKFVDKREGNERQKTGRILHHAQKGVAVAEERGAVGGGSFGIEHYEEETIGTSVWEGWGTCLKPAYEPIIVARKPCEGSIVDNVLKYGVGGINIDGCKFSGEDSTKQDSRGRFPANVILTYDESDKDEVCGGMPEGDRNGSISKPYDMNNLVYGNYGQCNTFEAYEDSGSASRYFYCAKATLRDREEGLEEIEAQSDFVKGNGLGRVCEFCGAPQLKPELCKCPVKSWVMPKRKNIHPTVKPTMLMQYLVRLVTPKGGTVLDPFNGSGSTGKAAMYENLDYASGYKYVGIEITEKYLPIAKARIENADKTLATEEDRFTFDGIVTTEETVDGEDW